MTRIVPLGNLGALLTPAEIGEGRCAKAGHTFEHHYALYRRGVRARPPAVFCRRCISDFRCLSGEHDMADPDNISHAGRCRACKRVSSGKSYEIAKIKRRVAIENAVAAGLPVHGRGRPKRDDAPMVRSGWPPNAVTSAAVCTPAQAALFDAPTNTLPGEFPTETHREEENRMGLAAGVCVACPAMMRCREWGQARWIGARESRVAGGVLFGARRDYLAIQVVRSDEPPATPPHWPRPKELRQAC